MEISFKETSWVGSIVPRGKMASNELQLGEVTFAEG